MPSLCGGWKGLGQPCLLDINSVKHKVCLLAVNTLVVWDGEGFSPRRADPFGIISGPFEQLFS